MFDTLNSIFNSDLEQEGEHVCEPSVTRVDNDSIVFELYALRWCYEDQLYVHLANDEQFPPSTLWKPSKTVQFYLIVLFML